MHVEMCSIILLSNTDTKKNTHANLLNRDHCIKLTKILITYFLTNTYNNLRQLVYQVDKVYIQQNVYQCMNRNQYQTYYEIITFTTYTQDQHV